MQALRDQHDLPGGRAVDRLYHRGNHIAWQIGLDGEPAGNEASRAWPMFFSYESATALTPEMQKPPSLVGHQAGERFVFSVSYELVDNEVENVAAP